MARRLPPLNALRAFEASARHLSFARAAEELAVTPAAISHQVRQLEATLGTPLFRRLTRRVVLTEAGLTLLPGLTEGLDRMAAAIDDLRAADEHGRLTVAVAPSFAAKWLVPRIERFNHANPHIDILIMPGMQITDFRTDGIDVAIRYGRGNYEGLISEALFEESITPMCAPSLVAGEHPLRTPRDLAAHTLIHDDSLTVIGPVPDWAMWLRLAGAEDVDTSRGPRFLYSDHAMAAAIDGLGVVLGRRSLATSDIASGRLVCPFELSLPIDFSYYLVRPEAAVARPKVERFREWVMSEIARDLAAGEGDGIATSSPP